MYLTSCTIFLIMIEYLYKFHFLAVSIISFHYFFYLYMVGIKNRCIIGIGCKYKLAVESLIFNSLSYNG